MTEFFSSLNGFEKILWYVAIFTSVVFLIQSVMIFFGGDTETDTDIDTDVDVDYDATDVDNAQEDTGKSFGWFSFKNMINFFLLFSWVGISCLDHGLSKTATLFIATGSGLLFVVVMVFLFNSMKKLSQDGTPKMSTLIGKMATVYLTIPPNGSGIGKINVELNGTIKTLDAKSDTGEFKTGSTVKIKNVISGIITVE